MLMDTILKGRKPDQDDLDFEGVHKAVMHYEDYNSLKSYLRERILSSQVSQRKE